MPTSFLSIFKELFRPHLMSIIALTLLSVIIGLGMGLTGQYVVSKSSTALMTSLISLALVIILRATTNLFSDFLSLSIYAQARTLLSKRIFLKMQKFRSKWSATEIINRFYGDLYNLFDAVTFAGVQLASHFALFLTAFYFLLTNSKLGAGLVVLGSLLYLALALIIKPFLQRHIAHGRVLEARLFSIETNFVMGYDYLKSSKYFKIYFEELKQNLSLWLTNEKAKYFYKIISDNFAWILRYTFVVLVIGSIAEKMGLTQTSLYWLFIAVGAMSQLFWSMYNIVQMRPNYNRCREFLNELNTATEFEHKTHELRFSARDLLIQFDPLQKNTNGVGPMSFEWVAGSRIWLHGPSGSGKTTLIRTLLGLRFGHQGQMTTPDENYKILFVEQEPFFFSGESLAVNLGIKETDNIDPSLIAALGLQSFFEFLPSQLRSTIGQEGLNPSRGQRVRLAILRALLCNPDVLFLDEPTAGLEKPLAQNILIYLSQKLSKGILVVADHRSDLIQSISPTHVFELGMVDLLLSDKFSADNSSRRFCQT